MPEDCADSVAHDEAFGKFAHLWKEIFNADEVEKWVSTSSVRQDLFGNMAAGHIRWRRSLGRPNATELSAGFIFKTRFWDEIWHIDHSGSVVVDFEGWLPGLPALVREDVSETDHYSIRYLMYVSPGKDNQIEVHLSDVPWRRPGRLARQQQRYLSSHGFQFESGGKFIALPEITVDNRPFFHP